MFERYLEICSCQFKAKTRYVSGLGMEWGGMGNESLIVHVCYVDPQFMLPWQQ